MSSRCSEFSAGGGPGPAGDSVSALLQLFGDAVQRAMLEDWEAESLELYREMELRAPVRGLPDDSILAGSPLQLRLMGQLAGAGYTLGELSDVVRDFLALMVSGTVVLEDETVLTRVFWVSRGEVADPVFVLGGEAG